ncbi:TetR/AcrR family transcriptional regulator [Pseudoclavibacter soli]|uniref:TetR/AcrR family transcriptional regulator n=1 Tax=Pseudoclavibacter soli TaxID=452623 RepID=UPI0003FD8C47|nr:TetR/AcrR family transcriptional regulator [Pseudoclavibacter soli]
MVTPSLSRVEIADIALALFTARGYDEVSAADIARAAKISRSTFFRQFGSKDDVIFADHDEVLRMVDDFFEQRITGEVESTDARDDVIEAAELVFNHFISRLSSIRTRDRIVRATTKLRDREIVTVTRYEKLFAAYLRRQLPGIRPIEAVQFADVVAATHNYVLRELIRSDQTITVETLRRELQILRQSSDQLHPQPTGSSVVAVFSPETPFATVRELVRQALEEQARPL